MTGTDKPARAMSPSHEKLFHSGGEPDPVATAIAALTQAARQTHVVGQGTANEHTEPVDFGAITARVLTSVAANLGDVDRLLAGRPGSNEAHFVREMVSSFAGEHEHDLLRYRTEPVLVWPDAARVLADCGLEDLRSEAIEVNEQIWDDALQHIVRAVATDDERSRIGRILANTPDFHPEDDISAFMVESLWEDYAEIMGVLEQRARDRGLPMAEVVAVTRLIEQRIDELWAEDLSAYREGYVDNVRTALAKYGDISVQAAPPQLQHTPIDPGGVIGQAQEQALMRTPLPGLGRAPLRRGENVISEVRAAGSTYLERARTAVLAQVTGVEPRENPGPVTAGKGGISPHTIQTVTASKRPGPGPLVRPGPVL